MRQKKGGYTLIELVLVMLLLLLVSTLVFSLTTAGSKAWLRLTQARDTRSELRTALSYLEVQVRKADREGAISIEPDPFHGEPAIHLQWIIEQPTIPGLDTASTWIYLHDGTLFEFYTLPGMTKTTTAGRRLVNLDDWMLVVESEQLLRITVAAQTGDNGEDVSVGEPDSQTRLIFIRSGGLEP